MPNLFATEDVDLKKLLTAENNSLINHMKFILGPFILRRLKSDVMQQLVPKIQQVSRNFFFYYYFCLLSTLLHFIFVGTSNILPYKFLIIFYISSTLKNMLQVRYVAMEKQQEDAYKDAIEDYRNASRGRIGRNANTNSDSIYSVLPRRQISNYFVQFRKVCETFSAYISWMHKLVLC